MSLETALTGTLFAGDYYQDSIAASEEWEAFDDAALDTFETSLQSVFERFPIQRGPNESQTEDDLIWPVLGLLGWTESLRQQNLSPRGREDVPDGLLFADEAAKARANARAQEWKRYAHGLAVVESKRWLRPLDRRTEHQGEETAPSTQMLRYLRRVDDLSTTREELEERESAWSIGGNRFESAEGQWLPLYEGKMVQAFDHRAASIVVNPENLHRPAQPLAATEEQHGNPNWVPVPQYWVQEHEVIASCMNTDVEEDGEGKENLENERGFPQWWVGWKDVTAPTNIRTLIASIQPSPSSSARKPQLMVATAPGISASPG